MAELKRGWRLRDVRDQPADSNIRQHDGRMQVTEVTSAMCKNPFHGASAAPTNGKLPTVKTLTHVTIINTDQRWRAVFRNLPLLDASARGVSKHAKRSSHGPSRIEYLIFETTDRALTYDVYRDRQWSVWRSYLSTVNRLKLDRFPSYRHCCCSPSFNVFACGERRAVRVFQRAASAKRHVICHI